MCTILIVIIAIFNYNYLPHPITTHTYLFNLYNLILIFSYNYPPHPVTAQSNGFNFYCMIVAFSYNDWCTIIIVIIGNNYLSHPITAHTETTAPLVEPETTYRGGIIFSHIRPKERPLKLKCKTRKTWFWILDRYLRLIWNGAITSWNFFPKCSP